MTGLFTADATGTVLRFDGTGAGGAGYEFPDDRAELVASIERLRISEDAEGTTRSSIECSGVEQAVVGVVLVTCTTEESTALHQALGLPPASVTVNMLVEANRITSFSSNSGDQDSAVMESRFRQWMQANHPEDAAAPRFGFWTSVEEAEDYGRIRADYAKQWAVYLLANGCTYEDVGC